jgi:hypothetical protein
LPLAPTYQSEKDEAMSENEQIGMLIDFYMNLQRIKSADDWRKEIDYQIKITKAKLEVFGIATEELDIC